MPLNNFSANSDYMVVSTNEVASIISRFTPEMINDIVEETIATKFRSYSPRIVNLIESMEQMYKSDMAGLPDYINELRQVRQENYIHILKMIGERHQIGYKVDLITVPDIYSTAWIVYDFLISNFTINIINFFTNYIYKEKAMIYETLDLASKKKEISPYSKKIFANGGNSILAIIHANLEFVLDNICAYDITLNDFINIAYINKRPEANLLMNTLQDYGDFFKRIIVPYYQANAPIISTNIKLTLQEQTTLSIDNIV